MHITYFYISIIIIKGKPIRVLACSIWYRCLLACLSVGLHSVHSQTGGDVDIVCDICKKKTLYKKCKHSNVSFTGGQTSRPKRKIVFGLVSFSLKLYSSFLRFFSFKLNMGNKWVFSQLVL